MLFCIVAVDRPGRLDRRKATRPAHLEFLASSADRVRAAGPFLAEDGTPTGSMLIVEAPDLAAAEAMVAADPYTKAGLFESIAVRGWNFVIGTGLAPARS
jgi:uncharacterized protein YciI